MKESNKKLRAINANHSLNTRHFILFLFYICTTLCIYGYDKTENLLINGNFTNGLEGWDTSVSSSSNYTKIWVEDGICYFKAGSKGSSFYYNCRISQTIKLQPGKYKCSFNYQGSFQEGGCCKIFRIITSEDETIDTSDEYLIDEVKEYSNRFSSEYTFTIYNELYVMFLLSVQDHYGIVTSISNCILTRESMFLKPEVRSCKREYGDENPAFEVIYKGVVAGDESLLATNIHANIECSANKFSNVGEYPIKLSCTGYVSGYEIKGSTDGILTVQKALINVSCNDMVREYGDPNPEPTIIYDGFKNGEDKDILSTLATYDISATPTSNTGVYPIELHGANSDNYRFEYLNASLIIKKAPLSGIINNCNKTYGESNPTFSINYKGLKNNESSPIWIKQPRFITEANKYSDVGVYHVSASDYNAKNYTIDTIEDGTLTIIPRSLVLKANDSERHYYQDNPTFSYTPIGFVNGDDISSFIKAPKFSTDATIFSNVGVYPIEIFGAESLNYDISYISGNLIVNKRLLKVIADNKTRSYKTNNPVLTYSIIGFVNSETEDALLKLPNIQTSATILSDCGEYIINVNGAEAENYEFEYATGVLTISKIDQVIRWEQIFENIQIGDQIELSATADSGLPIEYIISGNVEEYNSGDRTFIDCIGCGKVTIRATQEGNMNYNSAVRVVKSFTILPDASIDYTSADNYELNIYTNNGYLINDSSSQEYIEVYDMVGNCKYHGTNDKIYIGKGLFIVRINGRSYKLICK